MLVYKVTNLVNNKVYVGKTKHYTLEARWHEHIGEARRGSNTYFKRAIRKYGKEGFKVELLCRTTEQKLNEKEKEFIRFYDSMNPDKGYNLTPGGDGLSWWAGKRRSPESMARAADTRRRNGYTYDHLHTPEAAVKRVSARRANGGYKERVGYKNTPETLEKMKAAALSRDPTPYIGLKRSSEAVENLRKGQLNRVANESVENKQKRAAACSSTLSFKYGTKRDEAKKLRDSGLSLAAVAEQLGMSVKFVQTYTRDLRRRNNARQTNISL